MGIRLRASTLALAVLASATLAGCGSNTDPVRPAAGGADPLTGRAARDLAQHFATTLSQGGVPIDRIGTATLRAATGTRAAPALRSGASLDEGDFRWSLAVAFFDAGGHEQPAWVDGVTARVRITARARGSVASAEHRASLGVFRFLDVRGLLPAETELLVDGAANDTAHASFAAADGSAARRLDIVGAGTLEALRQLKDETANPYPLGGTLRIAVRADAFEQTAEGEREAHYEATVVVTFNGTRYPTIEVSERWRYRMDLETGTLTEIPA